MHPAPFDYHRPASLDAALALKQELGEDARWLSGGHSLLPSMKLRLAQPTHLIDLSGVPQLRGIEVRDGRLWVGAMSRHREVEASELVAKHRPELCALAGHIADPQVRNRGTIGGSLSNADPAADYPAIVLALDALLEAASPEGRRLIEAEDWSVAMMTTALREGELLARVGFPLPVAGEGAAYVKVPHPASRFATVGIAARVVLDRSGRCTACRIAVTGVGDMVQRARSAEQALIGTGALAGDVAQAARLLAGEVSVMPDGLLDEPAKRQLCRMTARQALGKALDVAR